MGRINNGFASLEPVTFGRFLRSCRHDDAIFLFLCAERGETGMLKPIFVREPRCISLRGHRNKNFPYLLLRGVFLTGELGKGLLYPIK